MSLRLDGYVRVSRVGGREGEGYISPSVQREAISNYAAELDGEIVAWHQDEDYSGGNVKRPDFQATLERLRDGASDGIVVMAIDRFARSVADGAGVVREITERGQVFASCQERIDPRTDEGQYMLNTFLNNAELFLNQSKTKWRTSKARAVARGAHIGPTPIGYLKVEPQPTKPTHIPPADSKALGGPTESGRLVKHPTYGPAITDLFERASNGSEGDSALARWMSERAPRASGAPWQPSEVRRWLKSRVYLGQVHYGELQNPNAHEPLTDPETFERAQSKPGSPRRANGRCFLLAGLVRCSCCRYAMSGFNYGGADHETPIYRCGRARTRGCSESSVIVAKRLEDHVVGLVREQLRGLELQAANADVDLGALDRDASEAEAELQAFVADLGARRRLGEDGWQAAFAARVDDRDSKRAIRDKAYGGSRLLAVAADVEDLDHDGLRDLLAGMIRTVFVRRRPRGAEVADRVLVIWSDDPRAIELPGPHRSGPFEPIRW
jgi:DNA invertase Pin-like site-specific DNA recombinase